MILLTVIAIICIVFANYVEYAKKKTEIANLNKEFLAYDNSRVQIDTIITLMNKAIQKNKENAIHQDENQIFQENDTNSIKIYLEMKSRGSIIPMEDLILDKKAGVEKVSLAFSDLLFEITTVEYHKKSGQVKEITFTAIEELQTKEN